MKISALQLHAVTRRNLPQETRWEFWCAWQIHPPVSGSAKRPPIVGGSYRPVSHGPDLALLLCNATLNELARYLTRNGREPQLLHAPAPFDHCHR